MPSKTWGSSSASSPENRLWMFIPLRQYSLPAGGWKLSPGSGPTTSNPVSKPLSSPTVKALSSVPYVMIQAVESGQL